MKRNSEGTEIIAITATVVRDLTPREWLELILSVTGKDEPPVQEKPRRLSNRVAARSY